MFDRHRGRRLQGGARASITRSRRSQELSSLDHEDDDSGTGWNSDARKRDSDAMSPRQALRAIMRTVARDAIIPSGIGDNRAIGNSETPLIGLAGDGASGVSMNDISACGRDWWPANNMVAFRNDK